MIDIDPPLRTHLPLLTWLIGVVSTSYASFVLLVDEQVDYRNHRKFAISRMIHTSRFSPPLPPADAWFPDFVLQRPCHLYPERTALVNGPDGTSYTYRQMRALVTKLGHAFRSRGLQEDDVIVVMAPNSVELVLVYFAIPSIGAIVSGINPAYTPEEAIRQINDVGAVAVLVSDETVAAVPRLRKSCPTVKEIYTTSKTPGFASIADMISSNPDRVPGKPRVDPREKLAILPCSSGTTGLPKGVMITHYNIMCMVSALGPKGHRLYRDAKDTMVVVFPLFHIGGLGPCLFAGLHSAVTFVLYPRFDFRNYLYAMQTYKATVTFCPPPVGVRLAKDPSVEDYDLSSLSWILTGAAPMAHSQIREMETRLNLTAKQTYGMTETVGAICYAVPEDIKPHSIGVVIGLGQCKIVHPDSGDMLGIGEDGEVCFRGPQVMKGYWGNMAATRDTIDEEGWLHTGDIGHFDADGHLYLIDRKKELLKYKGYQVAPAELEGVLLTHPCVQDAAIVGVPDPAVGDLPCAHIVLKEGTAATEQDIYGFIKERTAPYKWLRGGVIFVDSIPKNPGGKILRRLIRDRMAKNGHIKAKL